MIIQESEFPKFAYSNSQVERAGKALAGDLIWNDETAERVREVFKIANNWRDSHALPMRRIRYEVIGLIRGEKIKGITAARLKRMRSIRGKLRKIKSNLNQIQDLAGCRAILPTMSDVTTIVEKIRQKSKHTIHNESDYIHSPKPDGYRSHHLVLKFVGEGEEKQFDGRRVELQVRTGLQHSWATAVEAVGLFRREDLKAGIGSADWLRLFNLMSMEFAFAEGCLQEDDSVRIARVREIQSLDARLSATGMLENLSNAVKFTDNYSQDPNFKAEYYLIKYNNADNTVTVQRYSGPERGVRSYDIAEASDNKSGNNSTNTVLVEVDEIDNLKAAYPNYFGDVQLFKKNLTAITRGAAAQDYAMPAQQVVPPKPKDKPDMSWLTKMKRWK